MHFRLLSENTFISPSRAPEAPFPNDAEVAIALTSEACFNTIGSSLLFMSHSRVVLSQPQETMELDFPAKDNADTEPS